jgi:acetyl esterase/lipase
MAQTVKKQTGRNNRWWIASLLAALIGLSPGWAAADDKAPKMPAEARAAHEAFPIAEHFRAAEFGLDPAKIAVVGFSAGGHLAANLSTHANDGKPDAADPVDRQSCRLQSAMLIYPWLVFEPISRASATDRALSGILKLGRLHQAVDAKTPPTFLAVGYNDNATPCEHCLAYTAKLHEAGVRFELHLFGTGGHGFGLQGNDPRLQIWGRLAVNWLTTCAFLPEPVVASPR